MSHTTRRAVGLTSLVVLAALAGAVPAAGATADSASFHEQTVTVTRGDVATIGVSHSAPGNLTIGSQDGGFEVVVRLGGSGSDEISLDTYETGGNNEASEFISGSGASLTTRPLDHAIVSGVYEMRVTIDGTTQAVGQLHVEPRHNTVGDVGIAPDDVDPVEASAGDVLSRVTDRATVAKGDLAVFTVNESGLGSAFDSENLKGGEAAGGIDVELVELDPPPNEVVSEDTTEEITVTSHASTAGDDVYVFSRVEDADQFYVVWDTSDAPTHPSSNQTYEFRVSLTSANHLVDGRERLVTQRVRVVEPTVELSADPGFELSQWREKTLRVNGTTNLAPTSEIDVRARQGQPNPYLWKEIRRVSTNGTFTAAFDFAAAERPTSFPLWVLGHRDASERTVELTTADAALAFEDQQVETGAVTVRNVTLSEGGFVRLTADNDTVGASSYLEVGSHESVTIVIDTAVEEPRNMTAVAVGDVNRDGALNKTDAAYSDSGTAVAENATVFPAENTSSNTTQTTTATATSSTGRATATTTIAIQDETPLTPVAPNQMSGSSGGTVPLSPLVAVVALAAAALLAGRQ
jgi:hypothetical protein